MDTVQILLIAVIIISSGVVLGVRYINAKKKGDGVLSPEDEKDIFLQLRVIASENLNIAVSVLKQRGIKSDEEITAMLSDLATEAIIKAVNDFDGSLLPSEKDTILSLFELFKDDIIKNIKV